MKFQDLKLEKERERERGIQEAKTTTYWVERERERTFGTVGQWEQYWERSTICVIGFAKMKWKKHEAKYWCECETEI